MEALTAKLPPTEIRSKWTQKGEKPEFINNKQEFRSVWELAHLCGQMDSTITAGEDIPSEIQEQIDIFLLAGLRQELPLRRSNGYRVLGFTPMQIFMGLDKDLARIEHQLYRKAPLDKSFLDTLYVRRSDLLHWCEKEVRVPPTCWMPETMQKPESADAAEDDDIDGWYATLSVQRRRKVACLEITQHLWKQNPALSYEDVRTHRLMHETGLANVFITKDIFKKKCWAGQYATEEAKMPGRRGKSER